MWELDTEEVMEENLDNKMARLNAKASADALKKKEEAEERKKKNLDFVQFNRTGLDALVKLKNPLAVKVFMLLSKEMNKENKIIVSQQTLAELLDVSRQSVSAAVKELIKQNMFTVLKTGSSSIYCMNADVVWADRADKKKYASFRATVLVSQKEQTPTVKVKKTKVNRIDVKK